MTDGTDILAEVRQARDASLARLKGELAKTNEELSSTLVTERDLRARRHELEAAIRELTPNKPRARNAPATEGGASNA